jgi:hypothetical protein
MQTQACFFPIQILPEMITSVEFADDGAFEQGTLLHILYV